MLVRLKNLITSLFLAFLFPVLLLAQSDSSSSSKTTSGGGGALIAYLICNSQKRRPIGGWLLYFYIQLYFGALLSIFILLGAIKNFDPSLWEDKALYSLYLFSTIPSYLAILAEVIVGSMLIANRFRNRQTVTWLKIVLAASFLFSILGMTIDYYHWQENSTMDFLMALMSLLWLFYFIKSLRVRLVLTENNWDPSIIYPLSVTPEAKEASSRWVKRYIIFLVSIIVIVFVIIFISFKRH
jgi:hypothetical protein